MKYAFISFGHSGSLLPLIKRLSQKGHSVDCYFTTSLFQKRYAFEAFEYSSTFKLPFIHTLKYEKNQKFYNYLGFEKVKLLLFIFLPTGNSIKNEFFRNIYTKFRYLLIRFNLYFIQKRKYDCIHIIGHSELTIFFHQVLRKNYRVHTIHEVFIDHFSIKKTLRPITKYLTDNNIPTVVLSQYTYDELEALGVSSNFFVIKFGLFETYNLFRSNCTIKEVEKIDNFILFFGWIQPNKGLSVLFEAIQLVKKEISQIKVVIAGNGNDPVLTKMKNDPNYIIINRWLNNNEIATLNTRAKIVVCPYLSASQSGIPQTSFLFHKPVLASDVGAFREVIKDKENSFLFEVSDVVSFSNLILELYKNSSLYERIVQNIAKFPTSEQPEYIWENIAEKYESIFHR